MKENTVRRPASTRVNLFDRSAIVAAIKAKMTNREGKEDSDSTPLVSHVFRGYTGHTDHRTRTFKKNRRVELKTSARRRQRRR